MRSGFGEERIYVVQTGLRVIERCILMTTDPGDLVLDPTCGSGTTAYVAEQWGRRWITFDVAPGFRTGRLFSYAALAVVMSTLACAGVRYSTLEWRRCRL